MSNRYGLMVIVLDLERSVPFRYQDDNPVDMTAIYQPSFYLFLFPVFMPKLDLLIVNTAEYSLQ